MRGQSPKTEYDYIRNVDCNDFLDKLEPGCAAVAFADPPFNLDKPYSSYDDSLDSDEYSQWSYGWIEGMIRALRPGGSLFLHNLPKWLVNYSCFLNNHEEMEFRHWIAWDAATSPMGKSLQPAHYGILYYVKKPVSEITFHEIRLPHKRCRNCKHLIVDYGGKKDTIPPCGPLASDVWKDLHRIKHKKNRNAHPCQLPVPILERLILMSSEPGELIVDPFMGTATTAVAARRLGRRFAGCDLDASYVAIGNERVERQTTPSRLNSIYVGCHRAEIVSARAGDIYDLEKHVYNERWTSLFSKWPVTGDDRRLLNEQDLQLHKRWSKVLKQLDGQLREQSDKVKAVTTQID